MKISMMSLVMSEKGYSPEEIVKTAVDCRMDGIDWIGEHDTNAKYLKKLCDDVGLPVIAHTPIYETIPWSCAAFLARFRQSLDFALELGAPVMMIPTRCLGCGSRELDRAQWLEALAEAAPMAKKEGVILTFEAMGLPLNPIQSAEECLQLLNAIPDLMLTFDSGNVEVVEDPVISYCKLAPYVVHAHFKDVTTVPRGTPGANRALDDHYYVWNPLNEGQSDVRTLWNAMKGHGYQGYVNIESTSPDMSIPDFFRKQCDLMREW